MAAMVEKMALIGQASWHGLEEVMPAGASLQEWRETAGLTHCVNKTNVLFIDDEHNVHTSDEKFALYRTDTKALLSVVGAGYNVVQPSTVLDFFADLIDKWGFALETAGSLAGGRRVWALARTGNEFLVNGTSDLVRQFVLFATSYDGTLATTAKHTSVRVVCQNTLNMCVNNSEPAVRVTHNATFSTADAHIELGLLDDEWTAFKEAAGLMHSIPLQTTQAARWYAELLTEQELTDDQVLALAGENRLLKDLMRVYETGPGQEATLWGAVQGVTAFSDHVRGRSADTRLNSAWFGQGASLKAAAWNKALVTMA